MTPNGGKWVANERVDKNPLGQEYTEDSLLVKMGDTSRTVVSMSMESPAVARKVAPSGNLARQIERHKQIDCIFTF